MTATNDLSKLTKDFLKLNKETVRSLKAKDKIYLPDEAGQVDLNGLFGTGNDNNGNNSDDTGNGTIPDSGFNTDPGKNLSDTVQLWSGTTSTTAATDVTLTKDLLSIGDGLQFQVQILKTTITNGTTGATSILPAVASNEAKPQAGKYVASVPIPISILTKNLIIGTTINVNLNGIGEGLETTKVSQAPAISILVKDSTTLTITNYQGFALDKKGSGNNGAFYDVEITAINSFKKIAPVPQLANGTVLFEGQSSGEIDLNNVLDNYTNIGDGIKIEFEPTLEVVANLRTVYFKMQDFYPDIVNPLIILKSDLLENKIFSWAAAVNNQSGGVVSCDKKGNELNNSSDSYAAILSDGDHKATLKIENKSINLTYDPIKIQKYDNNASRWSTWGKTNMYITKVTAYSK